MRNICKIFSQLQRTKLTSRLWSLILTIFVFFLARTFWPGLFVHAYRIGHCKSNSCSYVMPASTSARCPPIRPPRFSCTWVSSVSKGRKQRPRYCPGYGFDLLLVLFSNLFFHCRSGHWRFSIISRLDGFFCFLFPKPQLQAQNGINKCQWKVYRMSFSDPVSCFHNFCYVLSVRSSWN